VRIWWLAMNENPKDATETRDRKQKRKYNKSYIDK
jgi:hypothetical protein